MARIPELLNGHVTLEVELPGPAVPERIHRDAGDFGPAWPRSCANNSARRFRHRWCWPAAADFGSSVRSPGTRRRSGEQDSASTPGTRRLVFIDVAQEKTQASRGKKIDGQFQYTRGQGGVRSWFRIGDCVECSLHRSTRVVVNIDHCRPNLTGAPQRQLEKAPGRYALSIR